MYLSYEQSVERERDRIFLTALTEAQREVNPPCNEDTVEVTMCDDNDVAATFALFVPLPVVFLDLWVMP